MLLLGVESRFSLSVCGKAAVMLLLFAATSSCAVSQEAQSGRTREATLQRASVDGGEVEYEIREGRGESVVVIHGAFVADAFHPLIDQPSLADYRLINIHRRAYGGSSAEQGPPETYIERHAADVAAVLRDLGAAEAHVVGQSSGALIALQLAIDSPELVRSLVLLELPRPSEPSFPADADAQFGQAFQAGNFDAMTDLVMRHGAGLEDWKTVFEEAVPGSVAEAQSYAETFFQFEGPGVSAWMLDEAKVNLVQQPILYVRGDESPMPEGNANAVRAWFPQTELDIVPNAAHSMHMEAPRRTAEGIVAFWQRHW
jgi:pimeloyl-ACP methyl ester carboxylesterase